MFRSSGNASEVLDQLDILLTGGRLGAATKAAVLDVYVASGGPVDNVKSAQQAIAMTAEFNTFGETDVIKNAATVALSQKSKKVTKNVRAYKAAVMLFMEGGADTFNMIVPQDAALYEQYSLIRQDLAKQTSELLAINTTGQSGKSFGVHSSLDFLKNLYDLGQAAFVANIGSLVEPTTTASFSDSTVHTCIGTFSHEAQISAVQTLHCQVSGTETIGAGGRLADALATGTSAFTTATFSMSGSATWPQGVLTHVTVDENHKRLEYFELWRKHIQRVSSAQYSNTMAAAFSQTLLDSVQNAEIQEHVLSVATVSTNYNTDDTLRKQFYDVARLISARVHRGAERDLFFVRLGGFDHHDNAKKGLNALFNAIDTALEGFVAEMEAQEMWNRVVILSTSEFGRTLTSSKDGSDHGWAGNHFIVGGDVSGGKILNQYPATLVDNDRDLGRGRLIPEYPWESVMAPVAEWMGLETSQRHTVFPNIVNFPSDNLVSYNSLFSQ
jgi:cullin-associated NEDD8-dissociated protein 1